jgi:hypothetical protein
LIRDAGERLEEPRWLPSGRRPALAHYLIVRREALGYVAPHTLFHSATELLPVFCSGEAARRFSTSRGLGDDGWYVRRYSSGELVSLLCALRDKLGGILLDPLPEHRLADVDVLLASVSREGFIEALING